MKVGTSFVRSFFILVLVALPACSPSCFLQPTEAFDADTVAPPPDYSDRTSWAAMPELESKAHFVPPNSSDKQADAPADVFFVHPTTWFDRKIWNDPLDSQKSREMIDELIVAGQASAFNACCRVFAPLYRQATIGAYFADIDKATKAFEIAYQDVERAFDTFIADHNGERPFILAAHSQGSMHSMRLLERIDSDPELRDRLIAAYIPGFSLPLSRYDSHYEHLQPCESPDQTGCVLSWDTYREGNDVDALEHLYHWDRDQLVQLAADDLRQCTNPITWRNDEEPSATESHLGAVPGINEGNTSTFIKALRSKSPIGLNITGLDIPRAGLLSARCSGGTLFIPDLRDLDYEPPETVRGNYHLGDYELFYMDIRDNAVLRTRTWLETR